MSTNEAINERIRKAKEEFDAALREAPGVDVKEFARQAQEARDRHPNPLRSGATAPVQQSTPETIDDYIEEFQRQRDAKPNPLKASAHGRILQ